MRTANQRDLSTALDFISKDSPDLLKNTEADDPKISFNESPGFVNKKFGSTSPLSLGIELSSAYSSVASLVNTLAHELGHRASGTSGILQTNLEDKLIPNKFGRGPIHESVETRANEVERRFLDQMRNSGSGQ